RFIHVPSETVIETSLCGPPGLETFHFGFSWALTFKKQKAIINNNKFLFFIWLKLYGGFVMVIKDIKDQASCPIHTAPPILFLEAPVTVDSTLYSWRQRKTPIRAITSASL